ncbi:MAG: glycosyl transferase family 2, partial [Lachnospiraceae bacterium]|nr:glycosyl transferase family 2 [Lachnospiraceae bacterium]
LGICILFIVIALGVVVFTVWSYFMDQHLASGWVSLMGFMSLGFIGVFGLFTIVLRYLSVLINLSFRQRHHLIEDIEKISGN